MRHASAMRLHMSLTSPYARKVRIAAVELGLEHEIEPVLVDPHTDPAFRAVTPLSKVPALELDDGRVLFESLLLLEFLDGIAGDFTLLPANGAARWDVLARHALANGIIDATVAIVTERRRPEALRSAAAVNRQEAAISAGLLRLESTPPDPEAPFDAGALTLAAALGYLDLRMPTLAWREDRPGLAAWSGVIERRPSVERTRPPG